MNGWIRGIVVGAGVMYLLDPQHGRRRRALVRDQVTHFVHLTQDAVDDVSHDFTNRYRGAINRTRQHAHAEPVSDDVLVERVRSRLGRVVSHPRAISVEAEGGGRIRLQGAIFSREVDRALRRVAAIPGVREVDNQLQPHDAADTPELQGGAVEAPESQLDITQRRWLPATRAVVGAAGALLALNGLVRPGALRTAAGLAGIGWLARAMTNKPWSELLDADLMPEDAEASA